jgi:hypothetical protein
MRELAACKQESKLDCGIEDGLGVGGLYGGGDVSNMVR